ncbi:MAG: CYTH and CHAD domain-containing protein [Desulfosporosinus sp.]|nr:CYTH and CHAD domain-containing protein [Desulfosporosinus sp.]
MGRKIEIELKLQIIDKALWETLPKSAWLRGLIVAESAKVETMEATYYDTPSRTLWKADYVFCVRREGTSWMATLKGAGQSGGGLHQRREWNVSLLGPELDSKVFSQMIGADKVVKMLKGQPSLEPLFKTAFTRWSVLVHPQNCSGLLEVVMDKGVISNENKNEDIYEVKIKRKEGTTQDLLAFGAELSRRFPLLLGGKSKYYRGMGLIELPIQNEGKLMVQWPSTAGAFLAEAVGTVLAAQSAYFMKQNAVKEIHDLRVAIRKLRSRLSFATPLYPAEEVQHWKDVLGSWNHRMAGIRELDVLQEEWSTAAEHCGIDSSNSPLTNYFKTQRDKQAGTLDKVIGKGKLTADLLAFWAWSSALGTADELENAWQVYASKRLKQWLKDVCHKAKQVDRTDTTAMHRLRIRGKKARYILERQAQHRSDRDTVRLAAKLQQFQECLGDIHDTDQGLSLLNKLRRGKQDIELIREIAYLVGWQARRSYDAKQRFDTQSTGCRRIVKRWLNGR